MYNQGPYPTHAGYYQGYATNEYPANEYPAHEPHGGLIWAYAPTGQQQSQLQLPSNPFLPVPAQPNPALTRAQKRNSRKKRSGLPIPAVPRVPQPMGNAVKPQETILNVLQHPTPTSQQLAPPGQKWILVTDTITVPFEVQLAPTQVPEPAKTTVVVSQVEPEKQNEEVNPAQAAANKLQWIIESSMACLSEQRVKYPLKDIGIIEAYFPQKMIETICGVSTIGSLLISVLSYLKIHGLPSSSPERLLGNCKSLNLIKFNPGALDNFADMSSLDNSTQEQKFKDYDMIHHDTVEGFLQHFSSMETFQRRPEVIVRSGITPCALQQAIKKCGVKMETGAPDGHWMITDVQDALKEKEYMDMAEAMMADFKKFKCPKEIKSAVLKSWCLYRKPYF